MRLPEPMLSSPGSLPLSDSYAFELKWDGFRAIVSTEEGLAVRSRRGWDMTELLPELEALPPRLVLDGELVALDPDGRPSFPRLCSRMLHKRAGVAVTLIVFDVLRCKGKDTTPLPYSKRRELLESLPINGFTFVPPSFDDGAALFAGVQAQGLEGIVAKRKDSPYCPGGHGWLKVKNRNYWRFGQETELAAQPPHPATFATALSQREPALLPREQGRRVPRAMQGQAQPPAS